MITLSSVTSQERTSTPAAGLRERNKAKRRDLILDSTLDLLRESSLAEVSMERIARWPLPVDASQISN